MFISDTQGLSMRMSSVASSKRWFCLFCATTQTREFRESSCTVDCILAADWAQFCTAKQAGNNYRESEETLRRMEEFRSATLRPARLPVECINSLTKWSRAK